MFGVSMTRLFELGIPGSISQESPFHVSSTERRKKKLGWSAAFHPDYTDEMFGEREAGVPPANC
jgi:hypothetical protein